MQSLIQKSQYLQQSANVVVQNTKIVELLQSIGKIEFVGSYALQLLFRPDIDLFVLSETCSLSSAVDMTKQLLDSGVFQTVGFANCHDYKCANGLDGYYWELIYELEGVRWKFDVWYTAEKDIKTIRNTKNIMTKLQANPTAREKILELKNKYSDGHIYRDNMNGFKIYQQILGEI